VKPAQYEPGKPEDEAPEHAAGAYPTPESGRPDICGRGRAATRCGVAPG
jgi:hypothetical protein